MAGQPLAASGDAVPALSPNILFEAVIAREAFGGRSAAINGSFSGREREPLMTEMGAQSGHLRSEKVVPPLPHVGHFRSKSSRGTRTPPFDRDLCDVFRHEMS